MKLISVKKLREPFKITKVEHLVIVSVASVPLTVLLILFFMVVYNRFWG